MPRSQSTASTRAVAMNFTRNTVARRMRRVGIDVAIVPPPAFDAARDGQDGSGPWLSEEFFDRALARAGEDAILWRGMAAEGESVAVPSVCRIATLSDSVANQTGVSPIVNSVVSLLRIGLDLQVRASATPARGWYQLDFECRTLQGECPSETRVILIAVLDVLPRAPIQRFAGLKGAVKPFVARDSVPAGINSSKYRSVIG